VRILRYTQLLTQLGDHGANPTVPTHRVTQQAQLKALGITSRGFAFSRPFARAAGWACRLAAGDQELREEVSQARGVGVGAAVPFLGAVGGAGLV